MNFFLILVLIFINSEWQQIQGDFEDWKLASNGGPISRWGAGHVVDNSNGKFYLFGGVLEQVFNSGTVDTYAVLNITNELWEYDIVGNSWTLLSGRLDNSVKPVYSVLEDFNNANVVGSGYGSAMWVKSNGNVVVFGGAGKHHAGGALAYNMAPRNDVWEYHVVNNNWAPFTKQVGGAVNPDYGRNGAKIEGDEDDEVRPDGLAFPAYWHVGEYVYIFGGGSSSGFSYREAEEISGVSDMWRWSIADNRWKYLKTISDNPPSCSSTLNGIVGPAHTGIKGNFSDPIHPYCLLGSTFWVGEDADILFLFGGIALDNFADRDLSKTLFAYSITSNTWTHYAGSALITSDSAGYGVYNDLGVQSASTFPGVRSWGNAWANASNIFMYGGYGRGETSSRLGPLDDFFLLDMDVTRFTWMGGDKVVYANATVNHPPARFGAMSFSHLGRNYLLYGADYRRNPDINTNEFRTRGDIWVYIKTCNSIHFDDPTVCNGLGGCTETDVCVCDAGSYGQYCIETISETAVHQYDDKKIDTLQYDAPLSVFNVIETHDSGTRASVDCETVVRNYKKLGNGAKCNVILKSDDTTIVTHLEIELGNNNVSLPVENGFELEIRPMTNRAVYHICTLEVKKGAITEITLWFEKNWWWVTIAAVAVVFAVIGIITVLVLGIVVLAYLAFQRKSAALIQELKDETMDGDDTSTEESSDSDDGGKKKKKKKKKKVEQKKEPKKEKEVKTKGGKKKKKKKKKKKGVNLGKGDNILKKGDEDDFYYVSTSSDEDEKKKNPKKEVKKEQVKAKVEKTKGNDDDDDDEDDDEKDVEV